MATIIDLIEAGAPLISQSLNAVAQTLAEYLPGLINSILPAAMGLLETIVNAIADNIGPITELATNIVTSLASFLVQNLPTLASAAMNLVNGLLDGIIAALPELIPAGIEAVVNIATGLIQGIPDLIGKLPALVGAIWDGLMGTDWIGLGKNILGSIVSGLGELGTNLLGLFNDAITSIRALDFGTIGSSINTRWYARHSTLYLQLVLQLRISSRTIEVVEVEIGYPNTHINIVISSKVDRHLLPLRGKLR